MITSTPLSKFSSPRGKFSCDFHRFKKSAQSKRYLMSFPKKKKITSLYGFKTVWPGNSLNSFFLFCFFCLVRPWFVTYGKKSPAVREIENHTLIVLRSCCYRHCSLKIWGNWQSTCAMFLGLQLVALVNIQLVCIQHHDECYLKQLQNFSSWHSSTFLNYSVLKMAILFLKNSWILLTQKHRNCSKLDNSNISSM